MNREDLDKLSTVQLAKVAVTAMQLALQRHAKFLQHVAVVRLTGELAVQADIPAETPRDIISKQVASDPGRFTDPRVAKLPTALANRLVDIVQQLSAKEDPADFTGEEVCALIDEVKQFDADMQPVYAWHEETRREMLRAEAALN